MRYRDRASAEIRNYRQLKMHLRNTSLPSEMLFNTDTADFIGHDQILDTPEPEYDPETHIANGSGVQLIDGRWTQVWTLEPVNE